MVTFQFEIDDDKWDSWKDTVPRSKNLDTRIVELIEADTEDSLRTEPSGAASSPSDPQVQDRKKRLQNPMPRAKLSRLGRVPRRPSASWTSLAGATTWRHESELSF